MTPLFLSPGFARQDLYCKGLTEAASTELIGDPLDIRLQARTRVTSFALFVQKLIEKKHFNFFSRSIHTIPLPGAAQ